jgi:hypothetical protein
MVAATSWLLTPATGALIGIAGIVVGVLGCLLTIWYSRVLRSRRTLIFARRNPSYRPRWPEVVQSGGEVVVFDLWLAGPADIRPADFIDGKPMSFYVDKGKVLEVLGPLPTVPDDTVVWPPVTLDGPFIEIAPTWLPAGRIIRVRLATQGPVALELNQHRRIQIADARVVVVPRWRLRLKVDPIRAREWIQIGACYIFLVLFFECIFWGTRVFRPALFAERRKNGEIIHWWEFWHE